MTFLIQTTSAEEENNYIQSTLELAGIDPKTQLTTTSEAYNSHIKLDVINGFMDMLPDGAWLLQPNINEFYHFPCVPYPPVPFKATCGNIVDRLASTNPDHTISATKPLSNGYSIQEQFSACVKIRGEDRFFQDDKKDKKMLFPVSVEYPGMGKYRAQYGKIDALRYVRVEDDAKATKAHDELRAAKCEHSRGAVDNYAWSTEYIEAAAAHEDTAQKQNKKIPNEVKTTQMLYSRSTEGDAPSWSLRKDVVEMLDRSRSSCPVDEPAGWKKRWDGLEPVHVVYAGNIDSVAGAEASIRSMKAHASGPIEFYFIGDTPLPTMPDVHWVNITKVRTKYHLEDFMNPNVRRDREDNINGMYANYARFALDSIMAKYTKKVLHIDIDTIVLCDAYALINDALNDGSTAIATVPRTDIGRDKWVIRGLTNDGRAKMQQELGNVTKSFNAGLYIADLDLWKKQALSDKMRQIALRNRKELIYELGSQPPMNLVITDQFEDLPMSWNRDPFEFMSKSGVYDKHLSSEQREGVCVLHYKGGRKPWAGGHRLLAEWERYGHKVISK